MQNIINMKERFISLMIIACFLSIYKRTVAKPLHDSSPYPAGRALKIPD